MPYVSIAVEGGMFPSDLLDRIAAGDGGLPGQRAADFRLDGSRRLTDEIQSAFSDARSYWDAFQRRLERSQESRTTLTREYWVRELLELLGYERLTAQRASAEVGSERYFISHRGGDAPDAPPVHIVAVDQELDRRDANARRSPHALVQVYLNRSDALWGIVTNGRRLRLLRESARLSKPTYLEFDLQGMIAGNQYSEFVLLYRLLHGSRLPRGAADAHECLLERYYQLGIDGGNRVREKLRDGVEQALRILGTAFLSHPKSEALHQQFQSGRLDAAGYYRQLLRLVYRLLFLMVAEERKLMFPPDDAAIERQAVYTKYYGVTRLRERAERHFAGDRYTDLWLWLRQTFRVLRSNDLARQLGLTALNGELFGSAACAALEEVVSSNENLLAALRELSTFVDDGGQRRRVNYAGLDVEEFGSVYESLLDFHPQVSLDPPRFDLVAGSERKQTGSYYTPPELVRELIESALAPVMQDRLKSLKTKEEKERALLDLRVCDPASGSGHFLLAAARRIARELARVRTGEDEPSPVEYRMALRDVIRTCLYAVDKNPLAVDLCKVALWIEGHSAGLPLGFLDHHVKCGDSLVGVADLRVLEQGIPDEAYNRSDVEQKKVGRTLKARNRAERTGQLTLEETRLQEHMLDLALVLEELERTPDDSPQQVAQKAQKYETARGQGTDWWRDTTTCHLWTAPFFLDLSDSTLVPTTSTVRKYLATPGAGYGPLVGKAWGLALERRFFHWPLEFPEVFMNGGFDVVLSNPPFMGNLKIRRNFGEEYRNYVGTAFAPAGGQADLCTYFYRRAYDALRQTGHLGMVATNTIGQGDTREGGLAVIVRNGGTINFAKRFVKWPGDATVEVNLLGIRKGRFNGQCILDERHVDAISSRLDDEADEAPRCLANNVGKAFVGSAMRGAGFVVEQAEALAVIEDDHTNRDCLFPLINGQELNSYPELTPKRWIICFFDWPLEKARQYPHLLRIVEERVKPFRDQVREEFERSHWWLFARFRPELHEAIAPLERVLVRSLTGDRHTITFLPKGVIYDQTVIVFAFGDTYHFSLLQSTVHEIWVDKYGATLRTDRRYSISDCFDTFPFPQEPSPEDRAWAERVGEEYHEHRRQAMLARNLGLTKTYNLFHNPECQDQDIQRLRDLHAEMDRAILACYGWRDLDPGHGFHQNERGQTRFTISPEARREVLRHLLDLNLRFAREESRMATVQAKGVS